GGEVELLLDRPLDARRDVHGERLAPAVLGHVQIRLVERERLHQRRHRVEDRHHAAGGFLVLGEVRRHDHKLRTQAHRARHRHRRSHAELPRLVARRGHHAARLGRAADDQRLAAQLGMVSALDGRIESVHVEVDDFSRALGQLRQRNRCDGSGSSGANMPSQETTMQGKIGLEEHFAIPDTLSDSKGFLADNTWPELESRLMDMQERRIREMDAHGMEMMILSLNAPAIQAIWEPKKATEVARRANDFLAKEVAKRPGRFRALAALAMQDPDGATRELQRCVKELGFVGSLVNGFSQINDPDSMVYLDDKRYAGFWAEHEKLDRPFYLHPRNPLPSAAQIYEGHPWLLGPTWAFGQETAVHALRLMASGLFDRHPKLQIIIGHL